ncbi:tryptophan 7-halogenase [Verrucomicrobiota bacterium sgz303538]
MIKRIVILGGGSAGLLAALTLKARLPALAVRIIRSPGIPIIGVGEGSTADLPTHLHGFCGLDSAEFHRLVKPTWKLGVRFLWGPRSAFHYTFTYQVAGQHPQLPKPNGYYVWDDFQEADVNAALMARGRAFVRLPNGLPDIQRNIAYHVENADLVAYLETAARQRGIEMTDATVEQVERCDAGVAALHLDTGERVTGELFLDASGFRSELLGRALGESFIGYNDTLFCDRAVAGGWERSDEPILPYTTAETMDAGWAWQIEHERHINRGYVYSSSFISDADAEAEFRRKNPKVNRTRVIPFVTGRYSRNWVGNVVSIGNASGFVEPLEATALLVVCHQARFLTQIIAASDYTPTPTLRDSYNRTIAGLWDEIRDFLAVHYRFNSRIDTPFWEHCRRETALHGAERVVHAYEENGPSLVAQIDLLPAERSLFQLEGFYTLLLGQKVPHKRINVPSPRERDVWNSYRAELSTRAAQALTVGQSLNFIRHPQWRWTPGFYGN